MKADGVKPSEPLPAWVGSEALREAVPAHSLTPEESPHSLLATADDDTPLKICAEFSALYYSVLETLLRIQ